MRLILALAGLVLPWFVFVLFGAAIALGHDQYGNPNWIAEGHFVSPIDAVHCCGVADCAVIDKEDVREIAGGLHVRGVVVYRGEAEAGDITQAIDETVPHAEVQRSRDGHYWRCKRPDGSRRCFFAPPPSI